MYPDRKALLPFFMRHLLAFIGSVVGILLHVFRPPVPGVVWLLRPVALPISAGALLFAGARILVARPTLIVNQVGITDLASFVVGGVGLIRWADIRAVVPKEYRRGPILSVRQYRFLAIFPNDPTTQGWWAVRLRALFRLGILAPSRICIPEFMLGPGVSVAMSLVRQEYERQRTVLHHQLPAVLMPY